MGTKQDIRESKDYRKFRKIVSEVESRLSIEKDQAEAIALHNGRTSRKLHGGKQYSPKAIIDAASTDLSARSRLVEIRVKCTNQIDILHDACKAMKNSMLSNFNSQIKARYTTVGDRNAFLDTMIASALEVEHEGKAMIKMLDDLISDIDKASYQIRAITDALQLLSGSKGGSVI